MPPLQRYEERWLMAYTLPAVPFSFGYRLALWQARTPEHEGDDICRQRIRLGLGRTDAVTGLVDSQQHGFRRTGGLQSRRNFCRLPWCPPRIVAVGRAQSRDVDELADAGGPRSKAI